jgi:hypothetical protein
MPGAQEEEESEEEGEDSELARNTLLNAAPQTSDFNPDSGDASGDVSGDASAASSGSRPDTPSYSHSSGSLPGTPGSKDDGLEPSWPNSQDSGSDAPPSPSSLPPPSPSTLPPALTPAHQECVEPEMPESTSEAVVSEVARSSVIEMHRRLRDKDEQLLNAQQEISRIRREHAIDLASTRHDSESMATQAFQLRLLQQELQETRKRITITAQTNSLSESIVHEVEDLRRQVLKLKEEADKETVVNTIVIHERFLERFEAGLESRVALAETERALAQQQQELMAHEALLAREQLRAERLGIHMSKLYCTERRHNMYIYVSMYCMYIAQKEDIICMYVCILHKQNH